MISLTLMHEAVKVVFSFSDVQNTHSLANIEDHLHVARLWQKGLSIDCYVVVQRRHHIFDTRYTDCKLSWITLTQTMVSQNYSLSRATKIPRAELISDSLALSQTPAEAASSRTRTQCESVFSVQLPAFAGTNLHCLVREATGWEKLACSINQAGSWTRVYKMLVWCQSVASPGRHPNTTISIMSYHNCPCLTRFVFWCNVPDQLTYKQVHIVVKKQPVEMRKNLPHAGADLTWRQTIDERQQFLKELCTQRVLQYMPRLADSTTNCIVT